MARSFDDGSTAVPGDIERPVGRVIVIGAGIAGLVTANALAHAGIEVVVLEGRDRHGGRTCTIDLGGAPVDLGASWIHTPVGNPMSALADELGVGHRPWNILAAAVPWDLDTGHRSSRVGAQLLALVDDFYERLPELRAELGRDATVPDGIERFVDSTSLVSELRNDLRRMLVLTARADGSGAVGDVPLAHHPAATMQYEGPDFGDVPVGGYRSIVDGLAAGLDIRLGTPVAAVRVADEGIEAWATDGSLVSGSHVVMTVPLGVLKAGSIRFDPVLEPARRSAIERLGFGGLEKVALRFERPFWTEAGLPHTLVLGANGLVPFDLLAGLDSIDGSPAVLAFVQPQAREDLDRAGTDLVDQVLEGIGRLVGRPAPSPRAEIATDWASDPCSRGSYAYIRLGSSPADPELLGQPHAGRVLFAGEATSHARIGYTDGALSTGIREAKRLLGVSAVELGRLPD